MFTIIEEMIIKKSHRFMNKGTVEIHYTPEKELQLILGSNGFGKSSLLDEASPLPPNKKSYAQGGYKYIRLRHNNSVFELEADFSSGAKYSFRVDGSKENLNSGRTLTVQKKLVEEWLGYTQEIHDLILGRVDFVGMTVSQRKEWIVKLCPSDTSFAMRVLKEADKQYNQLKGTVKKTKEKLFKLETDLISDAELQEIQSSIDLRLAQLEELTPHIDNTTKWTNGASSKLCELEDSIAASVRKIKMHSGRIKVGLRTIGSFPRDVLPQRVREALRDESDVIASLTSQIKTHYEEHNHLEEMIASLANDAEITTQDIEARVGQIKTELASMPEDDKLAKIGDLRELTKQACEVSSVLNNLLSRMPENPNKSIYSQVIMQGLEKQLEDTHLVLTKAKHQLENASRRKAQIEDQNDIECPECNNVWRPGVGKNEIAIVKEKIVTGHKEVTAIETTIHELRLARGIQDNYRELILEYTQLVKAYPRLHLLWELIDDSELLYDSPKTLMPMVLSFVNSIDRAIVREDLVTELAKLDSVLSVRKLSSATNEESLNSRLAHLTKEIEAQQEKMGVLNKRKRILEFLDDSIQAIQEEVRVLDHASTRHLRGSVTRYKAEKAETVAELLRTTQTSLAMLQERLNSNASKLEVCNTFSGMIDDMSAEMRDLKLISEMLSPFDGLVSEILNGFLSEFTGAMNEIAKYVWDHSFKIHKCSTSEKGLDYRFPLTANEGKRPVADISEGSDGEKELINMLFTLVARLYLKIDHFPRFLDEVGKYFTESHRVKLYNYIKMSISAKGIGQVFVVSHFPSTHQSLTNADFNYIDPTGVSVPEDGNKTIKLK